MEREMRTAPELLFEKGDEYGCFFDMGEVFSGE